MIWYWPLEICVCLVWRHTARQQRKRLRRCRGVTSWLWQPSHSSEATQRLMTWWMTFQADLGPRKCWSVRSASSVCEFREQPRLRRWWSARDVCLWNTHRSDCPSPIVNSKKIKNNVTLCVLCRSNKSHCACVLPCVQDECWDIRCGKLLWWSPCSWWRRIPPWRPWWKWPKSWRPRWPLFSIGFWGLSGHVFPPFHCTMCLYSGVLGSLRCRYLLLGRVVRPCIGLCSKPVLSKKRRHIRLFIRNFVKFLHVGIACSFVGACAIDTVRLRGGAPRSFRNFVSLRNPSNFLRFWVFVILQSFHNVDTFKSILARLIMNSMDVHDESTVDSLLCLLLDLLGNAL